MIFKRILRLKNDRNAFTFLIFLFLSLSFWVFTVLNLTTSTALDFHIDYINVPFAKHLMQDAPEKLLIEIEGKGLDIMLEKMKRKQRDVTVDLRSPELEAYLGTDRIILPSQSFYEMFLNPLGRELKVLNFEPDILSISFIDQYTKTLSVKILHDIDFEVGIGLSDAPVSTPKQVRITGPMEFVEQFELVYSDTLTRENTGGKLSGMVALQNPHPEFVEFESTEVSYRIVLEEFTEKVFQLPVYKEIDAKGISDVQLIPEKVLVKAMVPVSKYDQLNENNLKAFVKVDDTTITAGKLKVELTSDLEFAGHLKSSPERIFCIFKNDD